MKIALTGTSSTGKTQLMAGLVTELANNGIVLNICSVDTRALITARGLQEDIKDAKGAQKDFQDELFRLKVNTESSHDSFISDRSFIDLAAYYLARCDPSDSYAIRYRSMCINEALRYDLHIYLPIGRIPFVADGFRPERDDFNVKVDGLLHEMLLMNAFKYVKMPTANNNECIEVIKNALSNL